MKITAVSGSSFGASVSAAGDVNDDGFDDFIVGAPDAVSAGTSFVSGAAYLFLGGCHTSSSPSSLCGSGLSGLYYGGLAVGGITTRGTSDARLVFTAEDVGDEVGRVVSGQLDVNGDGYADMLIGAPGVQSSTGSPQGAFYVALGGSSGGASVTGAFSKTSSSGTDVDLDDVAVKIVGEVDGKTFGESLDSAEDVNGDGYDDIVVGDSAYGYGVSGSTRTAEGRAYVFLGGCEGAAGSCGASEGLFASLASGVGLASDAQVILDGTSANDWAGRAVAGGGDINNDGYDDIIVGAPGFDSSGSSLAGATYVLLGGCDGSLCLDWKTGLFKSLTSRTMGLNSSGATLVGGSAANELGAPICSAGDLDSDGYADLLLGAPKAGGVGVAVLIFGR